MNAAVRYDIGLPLELPLDLFEFDLFELKFQTSLSQSTILGLCGSLPDGHENIRVSARTGSLLPGPVISSYPIFIPINDSNLPFLWSFCTSSFPPTNFPLINI